MVTFRTLQIAGVISLVAASMAPGSATAQNTEGRTYNDQDRLFVNCEYGLGVIFPGQPTARDITYTTRSGASASARQFLFQRGENRYSVTVVDLPNGLERDEQEVENAAEALRQRGEIVYQMAADYDNGSGIPGRQINLFEGDGRQLRASIYMANHRMYITEASTVVGDLDALQFEQSIIMVDSTGQDINRPAPGNPIQYHRCE